MTFGIPRRDVLIAAAVILVFAGLGLPVRAADPVRWEIPERLTSEQSFVQFSSVVSDPYGGVHAFWVHGADSDEPTNAVFYSYIDDQGYSLPNDILLGPEGESFSLPQAYCDRAGRLHLVWTGFQGIYYSSVHAADVADVKRWSAPYLVVRTNTLGSVGIAVDAEGQIHVVYSRRLAGSNVMYVRSGDGGATWAAPVALSTVAQSDEQAPDSARIVVDSRGALHVVWAENYPPGYIGRQVLYVRSTDGGTSWTRPYPLSERSGEESWNALPEIIVDSQDRLHAMWAGCGNPVSRCYRESSDGGTRWSETSKPYAELVGSSGRDGMVADPYGGVRWFGSLREPQTLYAGSLSEGQWSDPPQQVIPKGEYGGLGSGHFPAMTIAGGNRLHVLVVESDGGPLWHLQGTTEFPDIAGAPLPTISVPTPSLAPTAYSAENSVRVLPVVTAVPDGSTVRTTGAFPLIIASAATLIVVVAAVVTGIRTRGR